MADHTPAIGLRVLGATRLERDGRPEQIASARQRRLLAALAGGDGRAVAADVLIDVVWAERLPSNPRGALQTQLTRVRQLLGSAGQNAIVADPSGYALSLERAAVDAWHFEDLFSAARDQRRPVEALTEALALWDGPAFTDVNAHPAVEVAALRLEAMRQDAMELLASAHLSVGETDAALAVIEPLLIEAPYRDQARAVELRALCAMGRPTEALARCRGHRRRLADELGVDPSPLLEQVEREILDHRAPAVPVPFEPAGRPPPLPVSSFVGRLNELEAVRSLLSQARIAVIVGPGGVGKTRLALHAVHAVHRRYPDGVWWCDLASASPDEVAVAIAARVGVQPRSGESHADRLAAFLADRHALLVLDNCEHVVADTAAIVDRVVRSGSGLDVLATSRQPLGVDGEHQLRLGPLSFLEPVSAASPAVELFVDRARAAAPGFHTEGDALPAVDELCRQVGGLPLAIELAAACVTRMGVRDIADRIAGQLGVLDRSTSGTAERRRSLEGVLESSYGLLDADEQTVLDQLSVFTDAFTLDDAEALHYRSSRPLSRTIGGLVDKSMVLFRPGDGRYELLPPVQTLGRDHLDARDQREHWRARHAELVLEKAAGTDRALQTADEPRFAAVFDDAIAEFRTARAWLVETDDIARLTELSASGHWFAMLRTRSELSRWAEDAVRRAGDGFEHPELGRARACAANGAAKRGDHAAARRLCVPDGGDPTAQQRFGLEILGQVELFEGRFDEAISCSRLATASHAAAGDPLLATNAATVEAAALAYRGDHADAEALARTLCRDADRLAVPSLQAMTRYILAETIVDPAAAGTMYHQSITLGRSVNAEFVIGLAETSLAALELRAGRHQEARRRLSEVIDHWQRAGVRNQQWLAVRLLIEALDRDGEHAAVATLAAAYGTAMYAGPAYGDDATRLDDAVDHARCRLGEDHFAEARARGAGLTDDRAALLARALADPQSRSRPSTTTRSTPWDVL